MKSINIDSNWIAAALGSGGCCAMADERVDSVRQIVDRACQRYNEPTISALIPILQEVQSEVGYLPPVALERVSEFLKLPKSHVYGVATFYHQFRLRPRGKHLITICRGTACHVGGSSDISNFLMRYLRISSPEDTSADSLFTIQQVRCIGACSLAPIMKVDEDVYGKVDPTKIRKILSTYRRLTKEEK